LQGGVIHRMPTYEYECKNCSERFEVRKRFSEEIACFCPSCGSEARQVFFSVPIIFKGPGFYVTDNRKESDRSKEESHSDGFSGKKEADTKP